MSFAALTFAVVALAFLTFTIILFCFFVGASIDLIMVFTNLFNHFMDSVFDFAIILKRRIADRISETV